QRAAPGRCHSAQDSPVLTYRTPSRWSHSTVVFSRASSWKWIHWQIPSEGSNSESAGLGDPSALRRPKWEWRQYADPSAVPCRVVASRSGARWMSVYQWTRSVARLRSGARYRSPHAMFLSDAQLLTPDSVIQTGMR